MKSSSASPIWEQVRGTRHSQSFMEAHTVHRGIAMRRGPRSPYCPVQPVFCSASFLLRWAPLCTGPYHQTLLIKSIGSHILQNELNRNRDLGFERSGQGGHLTGKGEAPLHPLRVIISDCSHNAFCSG